MARELTVVNNNAGNGDTGLAALLRARQVRKIVCSSPRQTDSWVFDALYRSGDVELELVAQGNLAGRIRAAGAGIGAIFTPTGYSDPSWRAPRNARLPRCAKPDLGGLDPEAIVTPGIFVQRVVRVRERVLGEPMVAAQ